jgi:hypothetical protein
MTDDDLKALVDELEHDANRYGDGRYSDAASAIRQLMMERDEAREVMLCALKCTPSVVVPSDGGPRIVYDCGDPWELLRAFLAKHPPTPS